MSVETELKLTIDPEDAAQVPALSTIVRFASAPPEVHHLTSIYYDTAALEFLARRFAFRIRLDGERIIQTAKGRREKADLLHARAEYECELPTQEPDLSSVPDEPPFDLLHERVDALQEVFRTEFQRTAWMLEPEPGVEIECALDVGRVVAGDQQTPLCEIELELKKGHVRHVLELARVMAKELSVRLEPVSKAQRGYALLREPDLPEPVHAHDLVVPASATTREAFQLVIEQAFQQMVANEQAVRLNPDPEAVHQMRIGFRRLRSALTSFAPMLDKRTCKRLNKKMKPFLDVLGSARDWDVMEQALQGTLESKTKMRALNEVRETRRAAVRCAMDAPGYARMMLLIACWIAAQEARAEGAWLEPARGCAIRILCKGHQKMLVRGRKIKRRSVPELHRLRIACKQQRYSMEFFESLFPGECVDVYLKSLRKLQTVLGEINDAAMIVEIYPRDLSKALGKGRQRKCLADLSNRQAQSLAELPAAWKTFKKQPLPWS